MKLTLFTGPQCHLCDLAVDVINSLHGPTLTVEKVNIRDNTEYYHLYAVRIPVLRREDTQQELGWPFDKQQLETFIQ
jgi:hypothetical protein